MKKKTISQIVEFLNEEFKIFNNGKISVSEVKSVFEAAENSLSFIGSDRKDKIEIFIKTNAGILFCDEEVYQFALQSKSTKCLIVVEDPKLSFAKVVNLLFHKKSTYGIHPSAVIHPSAKIHKEVYIGPNTYVGNSKIEKGTVIWGNTYIYDNVSIGKNVRINAGCIIGAEGFGYLKDKEGNSFNFPHIGGVIIEDGVEIGSNNSIDRGALGNTVIKANAKIDNLIHIAHNVVIGNGAWVIANSMIGGSAVIDDNAYVGPSVSIRDAVKIGSNSMIGFGAVVTKNVPDQQTWTGNPAKELKEFLLIQEKIKKL